MQTLRPSRKRPCQRPFLAVLVLLLAACAPDGLSEDDLRGEAEGGASWISGSVDERFQSIGDQFGGFSQSKLEVGQRYGEFHWAVEDGNWDYATYQVEKMRDAMARGVIRRPGREASSRTYFLDGPADAMLEALESGEEARVRAQAEEFTVACNSCHVAEDVAFIRVGPPTQRTTVVEPLDP